MAVYVDNYRGKFRGMIMSHMIADSLDELHEFAAKLDLRREWFQDKRTPHYDVCQTKREKAFKLGAISIACRSKEWREAFERARATKESS